MKFKSRNDVLFTAIILGLCIFMLVITLIGVTSGEMENGQYFSLILALSVSVLLLLVFFGTNYELTKQNGLVYKSGPIRGKIATERITEIIKVRTLWVGLKPTTARNGLTDISH
jgi:hypothetical protein